jgi:hypothetical protein
LKKSRRLSFGPARRTLVNECLNAFERSFVHHGYPGHPALFALKQVAPKCGKHSGRYLFLVLGGSLLARGLWYRAKLKNILGDFGNRPGVWSSLHDHIGFHDLATDWPQ